MPRINREIIEAQRGIRRSGGVDVVSGGLSESRAVEALADVGVAIDEANQTSKVTSALTGASRELAGAQRELETDDDFDTQEERFSQARSEIVNRFRQQITNRSFQVEFDQRIGALAEQRQGDVRSFARRGIVARGRASHLEFEDEAIDQVGKATTPEEEDLLLDTLEDRRMAAVEAGFLSPTDVVRLRQSSRDTLAQATLLEAIREDPTSTLVELFNPDSRLSKSMTELRRQTAIDSAIGEIETRLSEDRANLNARQAEAKDARKRLEDETASEMLRLATPGQEGLGVDWLLENRDNLSQSDFTQGVRIASSGGEITSSVRSDFDAYENISDRALAGEDVSTAVREAFDSQSISLEDAKLLRKQSRAERLAKPREYVRNALKPSDFNPQPAGQAIAQEALAEYDAFAATHPDATKEEALEAARNIVRRSRLVQVEFLEAEIPPKYAVGNPRANFDREKTIDATIEGLMGEMGLDPDNPEHQLLLLEAPQYRFSMQQIDTWDRVFRARQAQKVESQKPVTD